jgi:glucose 1-dehydrogenase
MTAAVSRRLAGKRVLVTGAASGIGRAIACRFAQEGADIAINHYNTHDAALETKRLTQAASSRPGTRHLCIEADVAKSADVERMMTEAIAGLGGLDILVNNAGIQLHSPSEALTEADYDRVMAVNLKGAWLCAQAALRHFLATDAAGVILNTTSVHQLIPKPGYLSYALSKGAMENMTRTLALEYATRRIRVNAVAPGAILTPMNESWAEDPLARAGVESHIPMGRAGRPEEIAAIFAFLASDEASYITGQTIFACGGLTLFGDFRTDWSSRPS